MFQKFAILESFVHSIFRTTRNFADSLTFSHICHFHVPLTVIGRSTFKRSLIFKFEIAAILKFYNLKFEPSSTKIFDTKSKFFQAFYKRLSQRTFLLARVPRKLVTFFCTNVCSPALVVDWVDRVKKKKGYRLSTCVWVQTEKAFTARRESRSNACSSSARRLSSGYGWPSDTWEILLAWVRAPSGLQQCIASLQLRRVRLRWIIGTVSDSVCRAPTHQQAWNFFCMLALEFTSPKPPPRLPWLTTIVLNPYKKIFLTLDWFNCNYSPKVSRVPGYSKLYSSIVYYSRCVLHMRYTFYHYRYRLHRSSQFFFSISLNSYNSKRFECNAIFPIY